VTEQQLTAWMDAYRVAFEEQDAGAAAALFTPGSTHSYPEDGKRFRYDGIFEVALDGDSLCTIFREWWNTREEPLEMTP
jgi:hypothetical protein